MVPESTSCGKKGEEAGIAEKTSAMQWGCILPNSNWQHDATYWWNITKAILTWHWWNYMKAVIYTDFEWNSSMDIDIKTMRWNLHRYINCCLSIFLFLNNDDLNVSPYLFIYHQYISFQIPWNWSKYITCIVHILQHWFETDSMKTTCAMIAYESCL